MLRDDQVVRSKEYGEAERSAGRLRSEGMSRGRVANNEPGRCSTGEVKSTTRASSSEPSSRRMGSFIAASADACRCF